MAMSTSSDSSGRLPPEPPRPPEPARETPSETPRETPQQRLHRLVTDPRVLAAIAKVARSHDVPDHDIDDVVQEAIRRTLAANLPVDDAEAKRYINGIAARVACEMMGKATDVKPGAYTENPDEEKGEMATPVGAPPADFETRDAMKKLLTKAEEHFPEELPGFLESRVANVTAAQVAKERGVGPAHQRKKWAGIHQFMKEHGQSLGLSLVAALFLLVIGNMAKWSLSGPVNVAHPPPPDWPTPEQAEAKRLRVRALSECDAREWRTCLDDLDAANKIDAAGEPPKIKELRELAKKSLEEKPAPR
jgi:DNA-directed RNA polymerase specialized sigma24 family protein